MSNTIRRKHFNKKSRPFGYYWEDFSEKVVRNNNYIEAWKYHSDNYYNKSYKDRKQFYTNREDRKFRRDTKVYLKNYSSVDSTILKLVKPRCVKYKVF